MNQKDLFLKISSNKRLFRFQDRGHTNCIRLNPTNSKEHEFAKVEKAWELLQQGHQFIMEGILERGDRPDLTDLTDGIHFEFAYSEEMESLEAKRKRYPLPLEII